jgi:hypothetical protein
MRATSAAGRQSGRHPEWDRSRLKNPTTLFAFLATFAAIVFLAQVSGCNVHELGHALVGSLVGWEVEMVNFCTPAGGSVVYSRVGNWAGNVQGYAGGLSAAWFLFAAYVLVFARRSLPRRSPVWWAAGLGTVVWIGPQFVIAVMEGTAGPGEDYTELFRERPWVFVTLVILAGVVGAVVYIFRWRRIDH